jgi:hypothetical protein
LRAILAEAATATETGFPGTVPLSNVKRQFRAEFQLELSETMLGHSKLSSLLQDDRFGDICMVQLEGQGYTVVQQTDAAGLGKVEKLSAQEFCADEPLCLEGIGEQAHFLNFGPTPGPFAPTPSPTVHSLFCHPYVDTLLQGIKENHKPCKPAFCPDEPLCMEGVGEVTDGLDFGPTPGPFAPTPNLLLLPPLGQPGLARDDASTEEKPAFTSKFCPNEPLCFDDVGEVEVPNFGATPGPFAPTPCPVAGAARLAPINADHYTSTCGLPTYISALHGSSLQCAQNNGSIHCGPPPISYTYPQLPFAMDGQLTVMQQDVCTHLAANSALCSLSAAAPSESTTMTSGASSFGDGSTVSSLTGSPREQQSCVGACGTLEHQAIRLKLGGRAEVMRFLGEAMHQGTVWDRPTLRLSEHVF